jgi:hypothetical protein
MSFSILLSDQLPVFQVCALKSGRLEWKKTRELEVVLGKARQVDLSWLVSEFYPRDLGECTYIQTAKGVGCRNDRPSLPSRLAYKVVKVLLRSPAYLNMISDPYFANLNTLIAISFCFRQEDTFMRCFPVANRSIASTAFGLPRSSERLRRRCASAAVAHGRRRTVVFFFFAFSVARAKKRGG